MTTSTIQKVTSADGTSIDVEVTGTGPAIALVSGGSVDRGSNAGLAAVLAPRFTVVNYDRRGRGDSGDTQPYAVEREIEDIGVLIAEAGGAASVYGHSSGAALALRAAAHGLSITRLVLHEQPYTPDSEEWRRASREYGERLRIILAEGRRGDAAALFMTTVGMPQEMSKGCRKGPGWPGWRRSLPRSPTTPRSWTISAGTAPSRPTFSVL